MYTVRTQRQGGYDVPLASLAEIERHSATLEQESSAMGDVIKQEALEMGRQVRLATRHRHTATVTLPHGHGHWRLPHAHWCTVLCMPADVATCVCGVDSNRG